MVGLETVMGMCQRLISLSLSFMLKSPHFKGYVSWVGKYAKSNAILVDILNDAGAVPFVRTNVPQTLMVSNSCP